MNGENFNTPAPEYVPIVSETATVIEEEKVAADSIVVADGKAVAVEAVVVETAAEEKVVVLPSLPEEITAVPTGVISVAVEKIDAEATKLVVLPESPANVERFVVTFAHGEKTFHAEDLQAAIAEATANGMVLGFVISPEGTVEITLVPIAEYYVLSY